MSGTTGGATHATALLLLACLAALAVMAVAPALAQAGGPTVVQTSVGGPITPVIDDHLRDVVMQAERDGREAVVVVLDTPGGLVTSMRSIVQTFLNAGVPVVVWVGPSGADAASAGTFITLAAHVATMAPATTIGAATPVSGQDGETASDKIIQNMAATAASIANERGRDVTFAVESVTEGRAITADEAVAVGAVDLVAHDVRSVLVAVDGREVALAGGRTVTLETADAAITVQDLSGVRRLLQTIADPNLAFILISIGTLAILYEVANPGLGAGGIIGAIALVLAFFSLSVLPVNMAGGLLLLLAAGLFVAELFAPGVGVGAVGGTIALVLGGLFLFQRPTGIGIDLVVLLPTAAVALGLALTAGWLVRNSRATIGTGRDNVVGRTLLLEPRSGGSLGVRLDGSWWQVRPPMGGTLPPAGSTVRVTALDGIRLVVVEDDGPVADGRASADGTSRGRG